MMMATRTAPKQDKPEKRERLSFSKQLIFEEIEREFSAGGNTFFNRFDRLTVQDMNELRRSLEKVARRTLVVKHSIVRKILEKMQLGEAAHFLEGSILVTFGAQEPQLVSKTLVEFVKSHESVQLKGLVLDGKVYEANYIRELARLPSRKELLTRLAIRMKSPIAGFVTTLGGVIRSLVIVLNEVQKKKAEAASP